MRHPLQWLVLATAVLLGLTSCQHAPGKKQGEAAELRRDADMAQLRADIGAIRSELGRLAQETAQLRGVLERSPEPTLDPALQRLQEDFFLAVQRMRLAVGEYYMSMGRMPTDNASAGLYEPDRYRGHTLTSATVRPDGSVELVFDAGSGKDGGRIFLLPDLSNVEAMGIRWHCETPDYPLIKRSVPQCEYKP